VPYVEKRFTISGKKLRKDENKNKNRVYFGSVFWKNLYMLSTWFANRILNFNESLSKVRRSEIIFCKQKNIHVHHVLQLWVESVKSKLPNIPRSRAVSI